MSVTPARSFRSSSRSRTPNPWVVPPTTAEASRASQAPRLVITATARPTRHGGVVELNAALWNGDHHRWVVLTPGEARELGDELQRLADACSRP